MTPLRQFKGVPTEVVRKAEGKQFVRHYGLQCEPQLMSSKQPWYRYFDLTPPEIGELIGIPNASRLVHCFVHNFPKLQYVVFFLLMWFLIVLALSGCKRQPITSTLLRIDLSIVPDFQWDEKIHGLAETFLILDEHNTQHNVTIQCLCLSQSLPTTIFQSFLTGGCMPKQDCLSHLNTSSFPKSSRNQHLCSTPFPCLLYITRNSKSSMLTPFRPSRSKRMEARGRTLPGRRMGGLDICLNSIIQVCVRIRATFNQTHANNSLCTNSH